MPKAKPMMYGINNCDTIKKARNWLTTQSIDFDFIDYKKTGTDKTQLESWVSELGWEQLINKRGTTWRQLDDNRKQSMNDQMAVEVMLQNPSIIKRPLLIIGDEKIVGFNVSQYAKIFELTDNK